MTRKEIVSTLAEYGEAAHPAQSIAEALILIGALDRPTLPVERYHRHIDVLAQHVGEFARINDGPVPVGLMHEALHQVMVRHYGYGGGPSAGADEDCFDLTRVIDSRFGSSETLSILYAETARQLGWKVDVLYVPSRMLIRLESMGERLVADPLDD